MAKASTHAWKFSRMGGLEQVRLESAADLINLDKLDQKLWVALSCPTTGLEFDPRTLQLLDNDKDGRIRPPELIGAIQWTAALLRDPELLLKPQQALPLSAINDATDAGRALLASAKRILINLGKGDATAITTADTGDTVKIFNAERYNGDGIVPAETAADPALRRVVEEIIAMQGGLVDRSGKPGIDQGKADAFFAEVQAYADWWAAAETGSAQGTGVFCLGDASCSAYDAYAAVKSKIEDYFLRCRLAAYEPRSAAPLNLRIEDYQALAVKNLATGIDDVAALPLQQVAADRPLDLDTGLNPAWVARMAAFREQVVTPLLGARARVSDADWRGIVAAFGPHEAWLAKKKGVAAEKLGIARVREILAVGKAKVDALIAADKGVADEVARIEDVDKLVHFQRDLYLLARNFVNFVDFYDRGQPAIFQAGTLYLDQRSCELCIKVADPAAHAVLATLGKVYIAYCALSRPSGEKMTVAACFTQGDSDYLQDKRNGVFYDRKGRDWDATIVKLVDHPISLRQAFWSPYKKFVKLVEEQIQKIAATREKAVHEQAAANVTKAGQAVETGKPDAPRPAFDIAKFAGIFAAIGLALGAIGTAVSVVVAEFTKLLWWQQILAALGIIVVISGPSVLIAWMKLRQRTLGPLLEGTGWAINGRVKINIPLGSTFTAVKRLPPGSSIPMFDPFEDIAGKRRSRWLTTLAIVLLILLGVWHFWAGAKVKAWWQRWRHPEAAQPAGDAQRAAADAQQAAGDAQKAAAEAPPAK